MDEIRPFVNTDFDASGRPWMTRSEIVKLAAEHVTVVEFDDPSPSPLRGSERMWGPQCAFCAVRRTSDLAPTPALDSYEHWRAVWSFAEDHVVVAHRDEFPEFRMTPPDLYGWWLMRFAAEREDLERSQAAARAEQRAFHDQALQRYMTPRGRI